MDRSRVFSPPGQSMRTRETMKRKKLLATGILLLLLTPFCLADDKNQPPKPAHSVPELQQQIGKILKDSHTPGVCDASIHRDGPEGVAGLGKADVASDRSVTPETLFRIGST